MDCEAALLGLEGRLASLPLRVAARVWTALRARRRRTLGGPQAVDLVGIRNDGSASPEALAEALAFAMAVGAPVSAAGLAERLQSRLGLLPAGLVARAVVNIAEALLMQGERERARNLADVRGAELSSSAAGVAILELLGRPGASRLPDRRLNLFGLSRRLAEGSLSAAALAHEVAFEPRDWLRTPDAHLLLFSALTRTQPERALGFMNAFLHQHGLGRPLSMKTDALASSAFLARVQLDPVRNPSRGPLVSIVVAAHNAAKTIGYAVDSLLGQSYRDIEILIGDDASSDETPAVMNRYAADSRVRMFRSAQNQGAYNLRNALVAKARGVFVTFHDADDLALPLRIELQVARLRNSALVGCVTNHLRLRADGAVVFFKDQKASRLCRVSLMLRRELFTGLGGFRTARIGADEELQAKLLARFGRSSLERIAAPLALSAWSHSSATRLPGQEALEDGYRSPSRRVYSELVFRRYTAGEPISDGELEIRLHETKNLIEPSPVSELS